ncbi:MAG: GrrA/OscA1 family cyclophane-containing rSAM-modified RiPP [Crocosphaera sp.]
MRTITKITCVGFILAISTLTASIAKSHGTLSDKDLTIENRLSRLTEAMQERGIDISDEISEDLIARGWGNGPRGSWGNGYRGGFANRHGGGGFVNRSPWRNGGGFYNRYNGGGFVNRGGWRNGGGFVNRRW